MAVSDFVRILAGFGVDALAAAADPESPTGFTDITQWGRRIVTDRGRASVFVSYNGSGRIDLLNTDARFDATNPSSPYAGEMVRGVPIVVQTRDAAGSGWETQFGGYAKPGSWKTSYRDKLAVTTVHLSDASELLAAGKREQATSLERAGDLTGARIGDVADDYGWPAGWRNIDTGRSAMAGDVWGGTHWSHMVDAAEVEGGYLFFDQRGHLTFKDRHSVAATWNVGLTVHETTENLGSSQVRGFRNSLDMAGFDETHVNYVSMQRPGGTAFVVDARSSASVPQIRFARNRLKAASEADVAALAAWHGELWTQQVAFPASVGVRCAGPQSPAPSGSHTALTRVCGVDLRDRVAVTWSAPGRAQQTDQVVVERIRHTIDMQRGGTWDTRFGFSPHDIYAALNISDWLEVGQASNLNGTKRLAY